jgi:hypothetical protein
LRGCKLSAIMSSENEVKNIPENIHGRNGLVGQQVGVENKG